MMKNLTASCILIVCILLHYNANAYSQGITLSVKDASLDKVFGLIQKQTKYTFVYSGKQLAGARKVSVDVVNEKFEKVMEIVMDGQPLKYTVDKEYVIIQVKSINSLVENLSEESTEIPIELTGRIINDKGEPVIGATITVKGSGITTVSGSDGFFTIKSVDNKAILMITSVGYEPKLVRLIGNNRVEIKLSVSAQIIPEVIVRGNTGYQSIDKDKPGSFDVVNNELFNRRVSVNILERIENLTPGVLFDKNASAPDPLLIRGRNSIFSDVSPLIVLDNFPYDGNINNINPNDVETVTILKDASSASIWGARAGNGVIVITTKKGLTGKPKVMVNSNFTVQGKEDLFSIPIISSKDAVELEQLLFNQGYYDAVIDDRLTFPPLSPVQETLLKLRNGEIDQNKANSELNQFKTMDVRNDLKDYFYRRGVNQQHSISISGNSQNVNYYFSAGYDNSQLGLVGQSSNRFTLRSQNIFKVASWFHFDAGINYSQTNLKSNGNPGMGINSGHGKGIYPYADLVDANGQALTLAKDFRLGYVDTAGNGRLLDWHYKPFEDMGFINVVNKINDIVINLGAKIKLTSFASLDFKYQYQNLISNGESTDDVNSYSTRNKINSLYQPNSIRKFPIPIGDIQLRTSGLTVSNQARVQLNVAKYWGKNNLNAILGWEIKDLKKSANTTQIYGLNSETKAINSAIDFTTRYPVYYNPDLLRSISNIQSAGESIDRFISYYANLQYTYNNKYTLTLSGREDAANLFGVKQNQKGVPLWSAGASWLLSNEKWFGLRIVNSLRLRSSYGHTGNFSRSASAIATIRKEVTEAGIPYAVIVTPPNEKLRWEQNRVLNIGLDWGIFENKFSGKIEVFKKKNIDLMGLAPIDPTMGIVIGGVTNLYFGNVASVKGDGVDIEVNAQIANFNKFKWVSTLLFSYTRMNVARYLVPPPTTAINYVNAGTINPIVGKPVYSMFSYPWGGLDPSNGDPIGFLGKNSSNDYYSILNNTKPDSLLFDGTVQPTYFGAMRNSFSYANLSISIGVSYKMGYNFRVQSVDYGALIESWTGHSDYSRRWKKSGDEKSTNVPSIKLPINGDRDMFYKFSETLAQRGDHIRLEDISVNYTLKKARWLLVDEAQIYAYINNLNIMLWQKSSLGVDPYFNGSAKTARSISLGVRVSF